MALVRCVCTRGEKITLTRIVIVGTYSTDEKMTPPELEWHRRNQLFVMTEGGPGNSLDELNERLNDWNKGIVTSPIFLTVCEHTRYVMLS